MALRSIYISTGKLEKPFVKQFIDFKWVFGVSDIQKCKRVKSFSEAISNVYDISRWLEISNSSDKEIGVSLSNLTLRSKFSTFDTIENVCQEARRFSFDFDDYFEFNNYIFEGSSSDMFYDYVYMYAIIQNDYLANELCQFDIFSNIEFGTDKLFGTPARAAAIFKSLCDNNHLDIIMEPEKFKDYYKSLDGINEQSDTKRYYKSIR